MQAWQHLKEDVREIKADKINFGITGKLPARYTYKSQLKVPEAIRALFERTSDVFEPEAMKAIEMAAINTEYNATKKAYDAERACGHADKINEKLDEGLARETGYAAWAFKQLKEERPGVMSEKRDRINKGPLVALRKGKGGALLTGAACDEEVADQVAKNNKEQVINLEAVGHTIDKLGLVANLKMAPTAKLAGRAYQLLEEKEMATRRLRGVDERRRREASRQEAEGGWCVVGRMAVVGKASIGRVRVRVDRGADTGLACCFRMGDGDDDEGQRVECLRCDEEVFESGASAYRVAARRGLPERLVVPQLAEVSREDKVMELEALAERCMLHGERLELLCHCAPKACHADKYARYINERVTEELAKQEKKDLEEIERQRKAASVDAG